MKIHASILFILLLNLQNVCSSGLNSTLNYKGYTYTVFESVVYQSEASEICRKHGGTLATIKSEDVQNAIRVTVDNLMVLSEQYGQWTPLWIGLSKNSSQPWYWEHDIYGRQELGYEFWMTSVNASILEEFYNCAVFIHYHGNENSRWSPAPCFGDRAGFICQKVSYATTVTIGDYQYGIFDTYVAKSTAKKLCQLRNGKLAIIRTKLLWYSIVATIEAYLLRKDRLGESSSYWLDFRTSDNHSWTWRDEINVRSSIKELMVTNETNQTDSRCGILIYQNMKGLWKPAKCGHTKSGVVCQKNINVCSSPRCSNITCFSNTKEECSCFQDNKSSIKKINHICNIELLKSKFNVLNLEKKAIVGNTIAENTSIVLACLKQGEIYMGRNQLSCISDENWSSMRLGYCEKPVRCHHLSPINNGDITIIGNPRHIFHVGSLAKINCDRGYLRKGKEKIECTDNGAWSAPVPYCAAITCSKDSSKVNPGRRCNKPCESQTDCSKPEEKCLCDDWCGKTCFNPNLICEDLVDPHHGYILGTQRNYMATVMYSCHGGYLLSGTSHRRCRSDGKWTDIAPKCLPYNSCGQPGFLGNTILPEPVAKVVRGQAAPHGAWPWQVMLIHNNRNKVRESLEALLGGATIINENWILTSAHLFDGFMSNEPSNWLHRVLIVVGITELPE
uniref:P-selectin-like n=1 Tax=Styela clava TaxID=7725 RepID=UPI00193A5DEB|nr:P-selectin-like [Styela clava]